MGMILTHEYKTKFVFDNDFNSYHFKTVELYERLGVNTTEEMFNLAIQYYHVDRQQEALELYNKVIIKGISNDSKIEVYERIGDTLLSLQRTHEAKDAYVKSCDYGNVKPKIYRRLGEVYSSLKEHAQSIYYHKKALSTYLSYEWRDCEDWSQNDDFLYFTNYYSLAMSYSEINNFNKVIENANSFLDFYGDFDDIKKRNLDKDTIIGDSFIPELIVSTYKLLSLTYIQLEDFSQAKDNITKARSLFHQDVELAKIDGFIEGKLDSNEMKLQLEQLRQELIEKNNAIMILIRNSENKNAINHNIIGNVYIGSNYHVENSEIIVNQVFGDNATSIEKPDVFKVLFEILLSACTSAQSFESIKHLDENGINTYIRDLLKQHQFRIADQTLRGVSPSGKSAGELDILVETQSGDPITVIEALKLDCINKSCINLHVNKIFGYDANGLKNNIVLIYCYASNYSGFVNSYLEYIKNNEFDFKFTDAFDNSLDSMSEIRIIESAYLRSGLVRKMYHVIVNFNCTT
jgi:tetratricopeptide (TPR) repeat protein